MKIAINAYPVDTLQDWKQMTVVVDGVERKAYLDSYHIGNKEYFITDLIDYNEKPKSIEFKRNSKWEQH